MKLSIIVPYRDREDNLKEFLFSWQHFMENSINKNIPYDIWVIEQNDNMPFRFGKATNVGFLERERTSDYILSIGVDFVPRKAAYEKLDMSLPDDRIKPLFGVKTRGDRVNGVRALFIGLLYSNVAYRRLNGYANNYRGHGGEDFNMTFLRIPRLKNNHYNAIGVNLSCYRHKTFGSKDIKENQLQLIKHLPHFELPKNKGLRMKRRANRIQEESMYVDGINNCPYKVIERNKVSDKVYHLKVDFMHEGQDKLTFLPYIK